MHWWSDPVSSLEQPSGVRLHAISPLIPLYVNGRRSLKQALLFGLASFRLLGKDFDVLEADHIPFLQVLVLRLVAVIKRKPFIVTWHEVWGRAYWRQYLGVLGYAAWIVEELSIRLAGDIIAASPQTAERLVAILGSRRTICVAPNGIDLEAVGSAYPDDDRVDVAVAGRLMVHKRVDMLLESVAQLRAAGYPVTCRIIGNGPEQDNLHEKAAQLGIADAVDFRHDVSEQKDVYSLLKSAKVCVFPSAREGFGIAVLEALACAIPVITTSAPDNLARHLVARSARGTVCEPTPEALASAILQVLERTGDDVAQGPEEWLNSYSWEAMTEQIATALGV